MEASMTAKILQASMMGKNVASTVAISAQTRLRTTHHVKYACQRAAIRASQLSRWVTKSGLCNNCASRLLAIYLIEESFAQGL